MIRWTVIIGLGNGLSPVCHQAITWSNDGSFLSNTLHYQTTFSEISHLSNNTVENWLNSQNPECTCSISHNTPFRTEMCRFLFWMEHCGIWNMCILGFVNLVYSNINFGAGNTICWNLCLQMIAILFQSHCVKRVKDIKQDLVVYLYCCGIFMGQLLLRFTATE